VRHRGEDMEAPAEARFVSSRLGQRADGGPPRKGGIPARATRSSAKAAGLPTAERCRRVVFGASARRAGCFGSTVAAATGSACLAGAQDDSDEDAGTGAREALREHGRVGQRARERLAVTSVGRAVTDTAWAGYRGQMSTGVESAEPNDCGKAHAALGATSACHRPDWPAAVPSL